MHCTFKNISNKKIRLLLMEIKTKYYSEIINSRKFKRNHSRIFLCYSIQCYTIIIKIPCLVIFIIHSKVKIDKMIILTKKKKKKNLAMTNNNFSCAFLFLFISIFILNHVQKFSTNEKIKSTKFLLS